MTALLHVSSAWLQHVAQESRARCSVSRDFHRFHHRGPLTSLFFRVDFVIPTEAQNGLQHLRGKKKKRLGYNSHWSSSESHAPGSEPITVARGMANADWSYLGHMFTGGTRNEVYYLINLEEWWFCPLPHLPHRSPPITGRRRIDPGQARAEFILSSPSDVLSLLVHLQWFF